MRRGARWLSRAGAAAALTATLPAQAPIAPPAPPSAGVQAVHSIDALWAAAVAKGTRTESGAPGARNWVQSARYELRAVVDPVAKTLRGDGTLRYRNRSPDTLRVIALTLSQNLFRAGAPHDEAVPVTGGVAVDGLCVARMTGAAPERLCARDAGVDASLRIDYTVAWLTLPAPLAPGDSVELRARWHFTIPTDDAPRMGTDGGVTMIGYWYPQFAVYDDVTGWETDPYLATGEFYMDQADYDVRITLPAGYLVAATGDLRNAAEVLPAGVRERLQRAARSFAAVPIVSDSLRRAGGGTLTGGPLTWRYTADSVRDFAFYLSKDVVWDAMAAMVPRSGGGKDTVLIHALYRPREQAWRHAADFGRQAIEHFSTTWWPYPWRQLSLVEGIVSGGMEYPMLTIVSVGRDRRELQTTLSHEIGHMWFPMQVGSDERRFAWMDEGMASWMERTAMRASTGRDDDVDGVPDLYRMVAGMRGEQSMLLHADAYASGMTYTAASYDKLVVVLRAFAAEYGDSALTAGLRAYGEAWRGRHPYPPDFTRMVFSAAGADRDDFVREWVRGTGSFDARIEQVWREGDTLHVRIQSVGAAHLAVPVQITRDDRAPETVLIPAAAFRREATQELRIGGARGVRSVVLDPAHTRPDIDPSNQRWVP